MKISFRTKLFLPLLISWLCLLTVASFNVAQERTLRMEERKTQLSNAGEIALSIAKEYGLLADEGRLPVEEAKKQALTRIKAMRYGTNGYLLVFDNKHVLMHPINAKLLGASVSAVQDAQGRSVYLDAIKSVQDSGRGFTEFVWPKPGSATPEPKLAFNIHYKPWNWTIMTGLYVDDVDAAFYRSFATSALILAVIGLVLTGIVLAIVRNIERSVGGEPEAAAAVARRIAAGDLNVTVITQPGDQHSLMFAMKCMRDALAAIVSEVRTGTDTIATVSCQIAAGNQDLSSRTEEQASSLEETASSMEELTSTVKQSADNAREANALAQSASSVAGRGGIVVSQVVDTMASINESSRKVVDIIGVIDGIAFQTNILALNAAVEAARAGEQGRGFAVVASEVRNLAQRSAAAAKEIKMLISDSVSKVDEGARLVDQAGSTMKEIVDSVQRVSSIIGEIMVATQEQTLGIEQINQAIGQMDQVTQQNAALVEEAAAASEAMQDQAAQLAQVVSVFNVDGVVAQVARPKPEARLLSMQIGGPA
jgi:methyl-accepting chemotaxis protein